MNDDIQFVNYAWGPLLLHFKYPKEDITKLDFGILPEFSHNDTGKYLDQRM